MILGIDTSNYTTSVAIYQNGQIIQEKKLLNVKPGQRGLRQSEAVFQHIVNLPELFNKINFDNIQAVGVSTRPRNAQGSYMPCFLVGENTAFAVSKTNNVPLHKTSHQVGHILAALYSVDLINLIYQPFIAFHLSGGTTEALLVKPDDNEIIKANVISKSLDLKAGQAIDRAGVMLGLRFPCGRQLDELSQNSSKSFKVKPSMIGADCSLSGIENKTKAMIESNQEPCDVAKFVLTGITNAVDKMIENIVADYGDLPIVFSGGVSSNTMLRNVISNKYNAYFAKPEFSLDNAAGVAIYAAIKNDLL